MIIFKIEKKSIMLIQNKEILLINLKKQDNLGPKI